MVTKSGEYKYSQSVYPQINPNMTYKQNEWKDMANAVGNSSVCAKSKYTRAKNKNGVYEYTEPLLLTAHDFRLEVPTNAYVKNVTIEVRMKVDSSKISVNAPSAWFMVYNGTGKVTQQKTKGKTGWYNDNYRVYKSSKLSTSYQIFSYTLPGTEWNKKKFDTAQLNKTVMGIDIHFEDPEKMSANAVGVSLAWVRIKVDYDMPKYYLTYTPNGTEVNPVEIDLGQKYNLKAEFGNRTKANGGTQTVDIELPFGTSLISYTASNNSSLIVEDEIEGKYQWVCSGKGLAKNTLDLQLRSNLGGLQAINSTFNNNTNVKEYIHSELADGDYVNCRVTSGEVQQLKPTCFDITAKVHSTDGQVIFTAQAEFENPPDHSKISEEFKNQYPHGNNGNYLVEWSLLQSSSAEGVSIDYSTSDLICFNVPVNETVEIKFRGCFIPINSGQNTFYLVNTSDGSSYGYTYQAKPFSLTLNLKPEEFTVYDHRMLVNVDTDYYSIPFSAKNTDRIMVESECGFRMHIQKLIPYIGCVPLEHSHYDPKATFANDGVKDTYKNMTYSGKKGIYEEEKDLNVKVRPGQATTLEGLTKLDKPVPINTVPTAFEGDILNHRGWVELTKISVEQTNPLWYEVKAEVDYLTHNINTRFEIKRGVKVVDATVDSLLATVIESGDEFANTTYINTDGETVSNSTGYFTVDTDGSYIYDDEAVENQRTLIGLDNSQFVNIKSIEELPEHFEIACEWSSTRISEDKENNIERIITLLDGNNKPILEYQYYDLEFTDENFYKCTVTCRVMTYSGWNTIFTDDINLAVDLEALSLHRDAITGELVSDDEPYADELIDDETDTTAEAELYTYSDYMYGSTIRFKVNMNELTIIDEGYGGRELIRTVYLDDAPRFYQLEFKNKNSDGDTNDVYTFFDFEVLESVLISDFENQYANLLVSSFPVTDKLLLFTRESEEGTLYFYEDDGTLFTYIQEPFYMYFCGVDLKANNDISLFDLNNSYTIVYLQNGLVRMGFNRLTGDMYLAKYDKSSGQYITVANFGMSNYIDFSVGAFSDDKIEIIAGTTVFTMYRGHPYVVINHEGEDIQFYDIWNQVYAEKVNGQSLDLPALWDLYNQNNMLPVEIGGSDIDSVGWIMDSDDENEDADIFPSLNLGLASNGTIYTNEDVIFNVSGSVTSDSSTTIDEIIPLEVESYNGVIGDYTMEISVDKTAPYFIGLRGKPIIQNGEDALLKGIVEDYEGNGISGQTVYFYEVYSPDIKFSSDKNIIQTGERANIKATVKDSSDGSLVSGETVYFYEIVEE